LKFTGDFNRSSLPYGYPDIPIIRIINANMESLRIINRGEDTIFLTKEIFPKQFPRQKTNPKSYFAKERSSYESDELLFSQPYRIFSNNDVEIYPYDYIPLKSLLIVRDLEIEYSLLKSKAISNSVYAVYNDIFENQMNEIKDFYIKRGFSFTFSPISITGSTVEEIETFIKNSYTSDPFSYLLLVGSGNLIPYCSGSGTDYPSTDLYYSLIDTLDYFPDIYLSRLPLQDTTDMNNYLNKIKGEYSSNKLSYNNTGYFIATNDGTYHSIVESTHNYSMSIFRSIGYNCDSFYGYYLTGTLINTALNGGRGMAVYSGHGSAYSWLGPTFSASDIDSLSNISKYPFVLSFACLTGNYSISDFLGYSWIKNPLLGSTSFIGSSQYTYWDEDDILQRALFDSIGNSSSLIDAFNKAKSAFYQEYGDISMTRGYFERYNYFMLPEIYLGNNSISDFSLTADKYQSVSSFIIDFSAQFNGYLQNAGFAGMFLEDSLVDSIYFNSQQTFNFDCSSLGLLAGDSIDISLYIPGIYFNEKDIHLIGDGQFVSLLSHSLSDFHIDTFFFDLQFKNFGNYDADTAKVIVKGLSDIFNLLSDEIVITNLMSESTVTVENGLILEVADYSDSIVTAICSIGTINGIDTIYEIISLDLLTPDFDVKFRGNIISSDTVDYMVLGKYSQILFDIINVSSLKSKNIEVKIESKSIVCNDNTTIIDSLAYNEIETASFYLFVYNTPQTVCSLNVIVSLNNYSDTTLMIIPTRYEDSKMYYGPVNGYYIYTSDMTDFENSPIFEKIQLDSFAFRQLHITDDTTIIINLPFEFQFNGKKNDSIYFNSNGILSLYRITDLSYISEPLPTATVSNPSIMAGWLDYRCEYYDDIYVNSSDAINTCFSYFDTTNYRFIIYYNKVKVVDDAYSFAIFIDTSEITVMYYDIPDSTKMIVGMQFDSENYLSFSGDSFFDSENNPLIKNEFALKFTNAKPIYKGKFSENFRKDYDKPAVNSRTIIRRGSDISISINKTGYYEILLYDISGRLIKNIYKGIIPSSVRTFSLSNEKSIVFLVIKDGKNTLLTRKLILL